MITIKYVGSVRTMLGITGSDMVQVNPDHYKDYEVCVLLKNILIPIWLTRMLFSWLCPCFTDILREFLEKQDSKSRNKVRS